MILDYHQVLTHRCFKESEHWNLEHAWSLFNEAISEITLISLLVAVVIHKLDEEEDGKKYHLEMDAGTLILFHTKWVRFKVFLTSRRCGLRSIYLFWNPS